jgi:geranylgeranyl diphosphate synthase type II
MDNAPKRRGQPTVHEKYNYNSAILSGDSMLVYAYEYLIKNSGASIEHLIQLFNKTAVEVCEGQQWDMNFENENTVSVAQYLKMIELKTAVLLGCAMKMGAIIGEANEEDAQRLYEVGKKLGIAFQLQDDVLDSFGDEKKFGKQTGGDIIQNKKTLLLIEAMEEANAEQRIHLTNWIVKKTFDPKEKVKAIMDLYYELNIRDIAEAEMLKYYEDAMLTLDEIDIPEISKTGLRNFAKSLLVRES